MGYKINNNDKKIIHKFLVFKNNVLKTFVYL